MGEESLGNQESTATPTLDLLKLEYQECATMSRFTGKIRFTFFASFMTFFFILIGGYQYVWTAEEKTYGATKISLLVAIAFFGLLVSFAAWSIEFRNIGT